ncbi:hypothetical protein GOODEAATRI_007491, partial [Goodea atripinnis]
RYSDAYFYPGLVKEAILAPSRCRLMSKCEIIDTFRHRKQDIGLKTSRCLLSKFTKSLRVTDLNPADQRLYPVPAEPFLENI